MDKNPETPLQPAESATKRKNRVVAYILEQMALTMLAQIKPDGPFNKMLVNAAEENRKKLVATHSPDEYKPILMMRDAAVQMAHKLAGCDDVDTLNACLHYMQQLNEGKVMIMDDVDNPEAYGLTPNV
ncbi:hypothetical protein LX87_04109 [Larkinella arboricola]|uniref:Uncharacterized protein n=1 Tax=Larkinella arboricola TaxID=643671 RepID=A0A327WPT3_LARAB|nr:hypothetical protein [Larkinella arboricola]RAJ94224.1 hypothetical protein LX87_04109 [Larkinella arboricola]